MKYWKIYIWIIAIYIAMQFASVPVAKGMINYFHHTSGMEEADAKFYGFAWGLFIVNIIAAPFILFMTTRNKKFWDIFKTGKKASIGKTILWGVLGLFMAMAGQMIAAIIEMAFGVMPGSDNTALLGEVARMSPIVIVSIVIFAPLFEEIVFRRILFGGIYTKTNFWVAALISAFLFSVVHGELNHTILYMIPGLVFAFLYYHTKSILAPMISHLLMNSFAVIVQLNPEVFKQPESIKQAFIFLLQ
ncbi:type II CAAX endopeptidase family protein [Sporosarcina thermotolerans]|uniref:Type II CAAX endopeptidase family protein n=1 Tax=Sporosarcina thermotolerans TaxID=633404 RepID=A0AAW9A9C0_9BACL|nr:type II CAAX endopeptidase family protein [Sporosarcina thermotolerans]MDW0117787.1 type II CAAX endopeptidase family protein [Sporosarcina thermotolerans]WHT49130.1 type II CAAX endopeptidase family protein [Sporosarcina thermotolerans]